MVFRLSVDAVVKTSSVGSKWEETMSNWDTDQKMTMALFLMDIQDVGTSEIKSMAKAIELELIVRTSTGYKLTAAGNAALATLSA